MYHDRYMSYVRLRIFPFLPLDTRFTDLIVLIDLGVDLRGVTDGLAY